METIDSFFDELNQIVSRRASSSQLVDVLAFTEEIAERLQEDPVFGEYRHVEHQDKFGKSNYKIHGYTEIDEADNSIGLIVSKWSSADSPDTLTTGDITQMTTWLQTFAAASIENNLAEKIVESNEAYELASILKSSVNKISRIRLHLFSNCTLSQRFKEDICGTISGIPVERHIWDLIRIKSLYESSREREAIEINLSEFNSDGIPTIMASQAEGLKSYLCVINANLLADLFERYGSRLLEGNVRSFLGMRGGVNKGIRTTIQNEPGRFFAFNNGIAATARNIFIEKSNGNSAIKSFTDLQIVNGGQTTASILSARKKDGFNLDNVAVPMKLTEVEPAVGDQLIPLIAKYANTQNKIAIADFFANHPVHRKLEDISRRLRTPIKAGTRIESKWFYERSRGQYQNERLYLSKSKRDIFDLEFPSTQVINKTDLAKYDSAWRGKAWIISRGAQYNFIQYANQFSPANESLSESEYWETLSPNFGDSYYQNMISVAILWKHIELLVSNARLTWYKGDYRAQIVAYTISHFFQLFRKKRGAFDLNKIWVLQGVPDSLNSTLEELASKVQSVILNPSDGKTNFGQWTKKEECWKSVSELGIDWNSTLDLYFIDSVTFSNRLSDSKKVGLIDDSISVQSQVLNLVNNGYWSALYKWPMCRQLFTPSEVNLLSKASTITGFMKIALEKDWRKLIDIKLRAEEEGFRL